MSSPLPPKLPGQHFIGRFEEAICNNIYWPYLRATQPDWSVVVGGTQYKEALNFAHGVQNDPIRTNIIFRHWVGVQDSPNDNGRLGKLTGSQWMERVGNQYRGSKLTIMPDNEGGTETVSNATEVLKLGPKEDVRIAFGAWNTHHPQQKGVSFKELWKKYEPLYQQGYRVAADYGREYVVAVPHIYYSLKPSIENLDGFRITANFLRYIEQRMTAPLPFDVVISEFGRLRNPHGDGLLADEGAPLEGVSGVQYAKETLEFVQMFPHWFWVIFAMGTAPWGTRGSLNVDDGFIGYYKGVATRQIAMPAAHPPVVVLEPILEDLPPFPPEPENLTPSADDMRWLPYKAFARGDRTVNIRSEPRVTATSDIGDLTVGEKSVHHIPFDILTEREQEYARISGVTWSLIKMGPILGWVQDNLVRFDPNPPNEPKPKPIVIDIKYIDVQLNRLHKQQEAIIIFREVLLGMQQTIASEIDYLAKLKEGTTS